MKDRRMVLTSLTKRLRNQFNAAVAQIDDEDKWQKATVAVVSVSNERRAMDRTLSHMLNFIEEYDKVDIINYEMELI